MLVPNTCELDMPQIAGLASPAALELNLEISFILAAKLRFSCVGISNKLFSHLILGDGEAVAETCALLPVGKHSVVRSPHKWLRWNLYAELILF